MNEPKLAALCETEAEATLAWWRLEGELKRNNK